MFLKFNEWRAWTRTQPWSVRWLIYLILFRPIIDNFYFLKEISPFLSPLFIVGVITPILTIVAFITTRHRLNTSLDYLFRVWMLLSFFAMYFFVYYEIDIIDYFYTILKMSLVFYLYFLYRLFIRDIKDLHGLLQTYVYSSFFVLGLFLYEILINPISVEYSRGLRRLQGSFGDVTSYAFMLVFMLVVVTYSRLRNAANKSRGQGYLPILILIGVGILVLININHAATIIIFVVVLLMFILYTSRLNMGLTLVVLSTSMIIILLYGQEIYTSTVQPVFDKDIQVFEGREQSKYLMHGRFGRWETFIDNYVSAPIVSQLFGVTLAFDHPAWYVLATTSNGVHNDFLRVLASSGYIGMLVYIAIILVFVSKYRKLPFSQRYLAAVSLVVMLLYSISVTPTFYPSFLYVFMAVFTYVVAATRYKKQVLAPGTKAATLPAGTQASA
jgi:hypothetical protein